MSNYHIFNEVALLSLAHFNEVALNTLKYLNVTQATVLNVNSSYALTKLFYLKINALYIVIHIHFATVKQC